MIQYDVKKFIPTFLLRDKNCYALAMAIQAGINYMNDHVEDALKTLLDVDAMPAWRLDDLLSEYNIYLGDNPTENQMRNAARQAWMVNAMAGTEDGLEMAIDQVVKGNVAIRNVNYSAAGTTDIIIAEKVTERNIRDIRSAAASFGTISNVTGIFQGQAIVFGMDAKMSIFGGQVVGDAYIGKAMQDLLEDTTSTQILASTVNIYVNDDLSNKYSITPRIHNANESKLLFDIPVDIGDKVKGFGLYYNGGQCYWSMQPTQVYTGYLLGAKFVKADGRKYRQLPNNIVPFAQKILDEVKTKLTGMQAVMIFDDGTERQCSTSRSTMSGDGNCYMQIRLGLSDYTGSWKALNLMDKNGNILLSVLPKAGYAKTNGNYRTMNVYLYLYSMKESG